AAAAGGQAPAVRAERHPQNRTRVTPEKQGLLRSRQVPDLHGLILAARCEPPAVRTEGDVEKPLGLPVNRPDWLPGRGVPDHDVAGRGEGPLADRRQPFAARPEPHAPDPPPPRK